MRKDYHMHPQIIRGQEYFDAFAAQAIARGLDEICVTDHMPLSTVQARDRIPAGRVEDYCRAVRLAARRWEDRLSVKLGIEIDYHPDYLEEIDAVLRAGQYDFVVGSVHLHLNGQWNIFSRLSAFNEYAEETLKWTVEAARCGRFNALAHIDVYRWVFTLPARFPLKDDGYAAEKHQAAFARALDAIRAEGVRLEINPHIAIPANDPEITFPEPAVVKLALEKGVRFSYGSDAHFAENVGGLLAELEAHPVYGGALRQWEEET